MRILITGDWHCHNHTPFSTINADGTNSRLHDILMCVKRMCLYCKRNKIEKMIIVGDIFHTRKSIETTVLYRVDSLFKYIRKSVPHIVIIKGNHDESISGDGSLSIKTLEGNGVTVISNALSEGNFGYLPYTEDINVLKNTLSNFKKNKVEYIFGHLGLLGGLVGPSDFEVLGKFSPDIFDTCFKRVFLGHFHKHQYVTEDKNILYVGSPLQLNWGESGERKGFIVFDSVKNNWEFIENLKSPKFINVDVNSDVSYKDCDFVKITVSNQEEREQLMESVKTVKLPQIELKRDVQTKERIALSGKNEIDMLNAYVKHRPLDTSEMSVDIQRKNISNKLIDMGLSYLSTAKG